jgi:general stress protein YciG
VEVIDDKIREFLSEIGKKGGAKSKRKVTKTQARMMNKARWAKWRAEQEQKKKA